MAEAYEKQAIASLFNTLNSKKICTAMEPLMAENNKLKQECHSRMQKWCETNNPLYKKMNDEKPAQVVVTTPKSPVDIPIVPLETRVEIVEEASSVLPHYLTTNDSNKCAICFERNREIAFKPCGHFYSCTH